MTSPVWTNRPVSDEALALLLSLEGFAGKPYYPGGLSGGTLDYGWDLGRHSLIEFRDSWGHLFTAPDFEALTCLLGVRGHGAGELIRSHRLDRIIVTRGMAQHVFRQDSLPQYETETLRAFPGLRALPRNVIGPLTSLVFNRGPGMEDDPTKRSPDDRRREMRTIRSIVSAYGPTSLASAKQTYIRAIDGQLRAMGDRLWPGPPFKSKLDEDLHNRRYAEAAMVASAAEEDATPQ